VTPARRLLQDRLGRLSDDLDTLFVESRERARREQADQLNQAVRRLRIAGDPEELCATLENAAPLFCNGGIVLRVEGDIARNDLVQAPLAGAPALRAAIESREPQIAAAIASQVGSELIGFFDIASDQRVSIFPIESGEQVRALLCCWGNPSTGALELLAQFSGAVWTAPEAEPAVAPVSDLVTIAAAPLPAPPPAEPAKPEATWESLPPAEQQIHLRAQRFARVQAAEIRLYEAEAVQSGRTRHDLYDVLGDRIDAARKSFHEQFFASCPSMVDYLHLELLRTLANDDSDLLGKDYPGPLV